MTSVNALTPKQVSVIKGRLAMGEFQHEIAADYRINQGRINEIATGKRFSEIQPAKLILTRKISKRVAA